MLYYFRRVQLLALANGDLVETSSIFISIKEGDYSVADVTNLITVEARDNLSYVLLDSRNREINDSSATQGLFY